MFKIRNIIKPVAVLFSHTCNNSNKLKINLLINYPKDFNTDSFKLSQEIADQRQKPEHPFMEFKGVWPLEELSEFKKDMKLFPNFITDLEETELFEEIEPYMKRLRYEYDHWDDAIHGFRETERKHWYPHNRQVLDRVQQMGFEDDIMPYIHVLDLAPQGVIKPHVDSTRYCGHTIAGLSLLSDAVMRLVRTKASEHHYNSQSNNNEDGYRSQPKTILENSFYVNILLPRRSLYIMSHTARYNFTHEILANEESKFQGQTITKQRRISIICRNDP